MKMQGPQCSPVTTTKRRLSSRRACRKASSSRCSASTSVLGWSALGAAATRFRPCRVVLLEDVMIEMAPPGRHCARISHRHEEGKTASGDIRRLDSGGRRRRGALVNRKLRTKLGCNFTRSQRVLRWTIGRCVPLYFFGGSARPITPTAMRGPASPAGCDFRSSALACTTIDRPTILPNSTPMALTFTFATPSSLASMLPRSPSWCSLASGPPCGWFWGL